MSKLDRIRHFLNETNNPQQMKEKNEIYRL